MGQQIWVLFFCLKKLVGLNQGGGCNPPPSENCRVKILLVRSYLSKKISVKKKNIGRVNHGRGGVDDPPPENSRVKIVLGCC